MLINDKRLKGGKEQTYGKLGFMARTHRRHFVSHRTVGDDDSMASSNRWSRRNYWSNWSNVKIANLF